MPPRCLPVLAVAPDELVDLADDIARNGLLHPIVLDTDGQVLDGRNRLAACEMASVEPVFETYSGTDPDTYALSTNIARRHLSKGQQAMIAARAHICDKYAQDLATEVGVSQSRMAYAVMVLTYAPDLVDAVTTGATSLDTAYKVAQERKQAANSEETRLATLQAEAPDLASQVVEERLTLREAMGAWRERTVKQREIIESAEAEAARVVPNFQAAATTIYSGAKLGATGLITKEKIESLHEAPLVNRRGYPGWQSSPGLRA